MIQSGDNVLIGLSGGSDSVFLLTVLNKLAPILNISIGAAHLNHCIRGDEALRDENFAKEICNNLNIKFHSKKADIPFISKRDKISEESAGRQERYMFFDNLCMEYGYNKIAVAHNMNDSVETILINMIRGCSLSGLEGISPVNENIVRPIIEIEKKDIENYLTENKIEYCIDSTNNGNDYTRNKVRHQIIPSMLGINKSALKTIFRNSFIIKEDNEFLNDYAKNINCIDFDKKSITIDREKLSKQSKVIRKRILLLAIEKFCGNSMNIAQKHLEILSGELKTGEKYDMPNDLTVIVSYDKIYLQCKNKKNHNINETEIYPNGKFVISDNMIVETSFAKKDINYKDKNCIYIDYSKIKDKLLIRQKKDGDTIIPYGMTGSKKLKQLFNDLKIPSEKRGEIPILTDGDATVAVIPYRVSDLYKVTEESRQILKIQLIKEI